MFCPAVQGSGDVPSTAAGRSLGAGSWRQGYPPPPTCAQPQEHSPHNSRRPPQATAQATCGPVTPYQHVMGERRSELRPGSPTRRAGPGAARTRRYFGARILYRRACSQFSMRSKWRCRRYLTPSKVAPPAIMWQPEALWSGRQALAG